jgi:AraC-like DNA-binding protein
MAAGVTPQRPPPAVLFETPSVSGSYARALGAFLRARGLTQVGLDLAGASTPASRVGAHSFSMALAKGGRELGDAAPGLAFGARIGAAGFGLLGVATATAPTLRDALAQLRRFESLTSTIGRIEVQPLGRRVRLAWRPVQPDTSPDVVEAVLAGWVSFGRYLLGEHTEAVEVCFAHRAAAPKSQYEQLLACPLRFDAPEYSLTLAAELLDAKSRFAEPTMNAAVNSWLDRCTVGMAAPSTPSVARRVAAMLGDHVALAHADEQSVASLLAMSCRTLQRRLDVEGTSFRQLLDAARAHHAILGVLRGELPLTQLSADIGFDEQSSLCRAFRRWTGYAPLVVKSCLQEMFTELR